MIDQVPVLATRPNIIASSYNSYNSYHSYSCVHKCTNLNWRALFRRRLGHSQNAHCNNARDKSRRGAASWTRTVTRLTSLEISRAIPGFLPSTAIALRRL